MAGAVGCGDQTRVVGDRRNRGDELDDRSVDVVGEARRNDDGDLGIVDTGSRSARPTTGRRARRARHSRGPPSRAPRSPAQHVARTDRSPRRRRPFARRRQRRGVRRRASAQLTPLRGRHHFEPSRLDRIGADARDQDERLERAGELTPRTTERVLAVDARHTVVGHRCDRVGRRRSVSSARRRSSMPQWPAHSTSPRWWSRSWWRPPRSWRPWPGRRRGGLGRRGSVATTDARRAPAHRSSPHRTVVVGPLDWMPMRCTSAQPGDDQTALELRLACRFAGGNGGVHWWHARAMTPRILLDCDPGHDDAIAIVAAARHAELVGITTVAGNAPLERTTHNALVVRDLLGIDVPVHAGSPAAAARPGRPRRRPLGRSPRRERPRRCRPPGADHPARQRPTRSGSSSRPAAPIDDVWLVPVGPLTNIAACAAHGTGHRRPHRRHLTDGWRNVREPHADRRVQPLGRSRSSRDRLRVRRTPGDGRSRRDPPVPGDAGTDRVDRRTPRRARRRAGRPVDVLQRQLPHASRPGVDAGRSGARPTRRAGADAPGSVRPVGAPRVDRDPRASTHVECP